ncbi:MAG: transglutaminase family protein [Chloroflexota bacterium]
MRYRIHWETTYTYDAPVRSLHTELRVLPADRAGQRLVDGTIHLDPPARPFALTDAWENRYHHVDFAAPVERLTIEMTAEVDTVDTPAPEPPLAPLLLRLLTQPTPRSPEDPRISALADGIDGSPLEIARGISARIAERCVFEVGQTDVSTTALDFLDHGRGVCQDFTHLLVAALRSRGLPARYVSGYLGPAEGEEVGEASHAWAQVLDGDTWYGFDAANGCDQDGRYIVTGIGRDYDDVPPMSGGFHGSADHEWTTTVRVRMDDSPRQPEQHHQQEQQQQ